MVLHAGVATAASAMDFKNAVRKDKASTLGQRGNAMGKLSINMLPHHPAIVADFKYGGPAFVATAADLPCVQRFDLVDTPCVLKFVECAIDGCRGFHALIPQPIKDIVRRNRAVPVL